MDPFKIVRKHAVIPTLVNLSGFALWVIAAGCSKSETSPNKNVFGTDNRELITTLAAPFSAVGRTDTACTATIIGRRLALTAAHCVYDSAQNKIKPELKTFIPFVPTGSAAQSPLKIKHVWFGSTTPEQERGKDWAVLLFDAPVDSSRPAMQIQTVDFGTRLPFTVNLAGFSADLNSGTGLGVHRNCQIRKVVTERLLHDCDAKAGISGGPVYVMNGTSAAIVAISVSEYRRGATDSVNVPNYSDEYANVAISAQAFASVVQALASVDQGGATLPSIAGVQSMANPNYTGTDPGNPPPPPPPPQDFAARSTQIRTAAAALGTEVRNMEWLGDYHHLTELSRYSLLVNSYARSIEVAVLRFQQGSMTAVEAQQDIQSQMSDLELPVRYMIQEYQQCGTLCSQGNEGLLSTVQQQLSILRTLTNSVVQ